MSVNTQDFSSAERHHVQTVTYKSVNGVDLKLDIVTPSNPAKTTKPRASYRLLPEAPALQILQDAIDAYNWIVANITPTTSFPHDTSKIIISGGSAGGYVATALAATPKLIPKPAGVLSYYGMLNPSGERWNTKGKTLGFDFPSSVEALRAARDHPQIGDHEIVDLGTETRTGYISTLEEEGLYVDFMTRIDGLGAQVLEKGPEVIPSEFRPLFPLLFGITQAYPRTLLMHGDADPVVDVEESRLFAKKLEASGVDVELDVVEGGGHGFEGSVGDVDLRDHGGEDGPVWRSLRRSVEWIDAVLGA
ncbi:hypothetical protein HDV00_007308 [Rhizophlyctis rosea]|nr:hypothetical protein HDV00_007308 [Rhizophlyctis rosea]